MRLFIESTHIDLWDIKESKEYIPKEDSDWIFNTIKMTTQLEQYAARIIIFITCKNPFGAITKKRNN